MNRSLTAALGALVLTVLVVSSLTAQDPSKRRGFEIRITEPVNQSVVVGRQKIIAEVKIADPDLVDRVEFIVGDEVVFVDREPPYECIYDFGEQIRSRIIQAVAYHVEEVTITDAVITRKLGFATIERVNRVILWVSATDKDDNFVGDLAQEDFSVFENGERQKVLEFYKEDRPITMAFLIDTSGSMQEKIKEVHLAASAFVDTLRPEDKALVVDFDDKVFLIQELTSDHEKLKEAIESTQPLGGTAIHDAVHAAYRLIGKIEGRKVVVLLTDGEDTFSQFGYDRILEEARSNSTMIYSIAIGGEGGFDKSVPKSFAEETGGRFFFVKKASELSEVYAKIAEELRTQFYLAYSTSNEEWDGRWMKVKVEAVRDNIKVRSRRGYFAVRQSML